MKKITLFALLIAMKICSSQVSITTDTYFQNFGTTNITSWTNNSTFQGWYIGTGTHRGYADITASANSFNSGGYYTYNCGSDAKIGSRGSGSATLLYYGVVLQNNTGSTISSIKVTYSGYQMSLAENGATNTINFEYIIGATPPSITAATGTNVPALNFTQLQSNGSSGSSQLNWYPCTQIRAAISACVPVTLTNGNYILLRWKDVDDSGNDHHMAIDNVEVAFDLSGGTCLVFLPIELLYFNANYNGKTVDLNWETASEINNDYFTIERSSDGVNFESLSTTKGAGNSTNKIKYSDADTSPLNGISYYRLKQTDFDGNFSYSQIVTVEANDPIEFSLFPNPTNNGLITISSKETTNEYIEIINDLGQLVLREKIKTNLTEFDISKFGKGIYMVILTSNEKVIYKKVIYN